MGTLSSFGKRTAALVLAFLFLISPLASEPEYSMRFMAQYAFPLQDELLLPSPGVMLTYDMMPLPWLNLFAQGEYATLLLDQVDPAHLLDGSLGAGFVRDISERVSIGIDITVGVYTVMRQEQSISGLSAGGRTWGSIKITPDQSLLIHAGANTYMSNPDAFMNNINVGVGYSVNLTEALGQVTRLDIAPDSFTPVFPVFYSWYDENSFAAVKITNNEKNTIKNVETSFFLEQYMSQPSLCSRVEALAPGESVLVPLSAVFNEEMLELTENTDTLARVIVGYESLGKEKGRDMTLPVPVYHRNAMTWTDDRRAAAFVSSKDPAALWFSKYASSVVRDGFRRGVNENMQYAMGIIESLNVYGINYVIDPTSVYSEMSSSQEAVDFLQYPYQTLMYRGGDCDDLSILTCSLLEAIGIDTAFITIPGHIFMAFALGMTEEEARADFYDPGQLVFHGGEAWVPLECTLSNEGFNKVWRIGAKEWNDADARGEAAIYPLRDSWQLYPPVSIPGAVSRFNLPGEEKTTLAFEKSLDSYVEREIRPQIREYQERIARSDSLEERNELGILYGRYGMIEEARGEFSHLSEKEYYHGWSNMGNLAFLETEYEESLSWYGKTLSINPEDPVALLGMSRGYYEMEEFSSSDYYFNQLVKVDVELSREYGYLKSFFDSTGRAWSFSDRLQTTQWSRDMTEESLPPEKLTPPSSPALERSGLSTMLSFNETIPEEQPPLPVPAAEPAPEPVVHEPAVEPLPDPVAPEPAVEPAPDTPAPPPTGPSVPTVLPGEDIPQPTKAVPTYYRDPEDDARTETEQTEIPSPVEPEKEQASPESQPADQIPAASDKPSAPAPASDSSFSEPRAQTSQENSPAAAELWIKIVIIAVLGLISLSIGLIFVNSHKKRVKLEEGKDNEKI